MNPYIFFAAPEPPVAIFAVLIVLVVLVIFSALLFLRYYKRCPSNRILVIYGKVAGSRTAITMHGGGRLVWPLIQDYAYLSLEPLTIEIDLAGALSKKNIRVNVPSTFTIGISTRPDIMNSAAERLLGLTERDINNQARDIILGQLRLVIATLSIEEINQDREKFLDLINTNVTSELNKIGLEVINVNIRDITDESGYIDAIGKKAAAEAINIAKVEVAEQNKDGAIGEANAKREQQVSVAEQQAQAAMGTKQAERDQRITISKLEAEGITGEVAAKREQEIAVANQSAKTVEGQKRAEQEQRIAVAGYEADAVKGENTSKAEIADYNAELEKRQADAKRSGEIAMANAERDILQAEKEREIAFLDKTEVAKQEIEKRKVTIDAEADAEQKRRTARGEADAILYKYEAEAEGQRKVLEAKADGYNRLLEICGQQPQLVPTLLMIEKIENIVAEQVKAVQNLKIDKVTVWDGGSGANGEHGSTAGFLRGLIGALPPVHDLAKQAGVDLPDYFGKVAGSSSDSGSGSNPAPKSKGGSPKNPTAN